MRRQIVCHKPNGGRRHDGHGLCQARGGAQLSRDCRLLLEICQRGRRFDGLGGASATSGKIGEGSCRTRSSKRHPISTGERGASGRGGPPSCAGSSWVFKFWLAATAFRGVTVP